MRVPSATKGKDCGPSCHSLVSCRGVHAKFRVKIPPLRLEHDAVPWRPSESYEPVIGEPAGYYRRRLANVIWKPLLLRKRSSYRRATILLFRVIR